MNDHHDETEFHDLERRARGAFDASVESVDAQTRSRLNQARQRAVATVAGASTAREPRRGWATWAPAGALAAGVLVAALLMRGPTTGDEPPPAVASHPAALGHEPLEMLAAGEEFEIATSDEELEFYEWVDVAAAIDPAANGQG
jgi:hypothetical protein